TTIHSALCHGRAYGSAGGGSGRRLAATLRPALAAHVSHRARDAASDTAMATTYPRVSALFECPSRTDRLTMPSSRALSRSWPVAGRSLRTASAKAEPRSSESAIIQGLESSRAAPRHL